MELIDPSDAYNDLMGLHDPNRGSKGLRSRCSICQAPSVTNQRGWQRCEVHWELDMNPAIRLSHLQGVEQADP